MPYTTSDKMYETISARYRGILLTGFVNERRRVYQTAVFEVSKPRTIKHFSDDDFCQNLSRNDAFTTQITPLPSYEGHHTLKFVHQHHERENSAHFLHHRQTTV